MLDIEIKGYLLRFLDGFQYAMLGQLPQPLSLKNDSEGDIRMSPSPVMSKQQPFDLKLKPSTLTFNNVSAIKRELENLLWHMVAAV